jgi:hypothetical protein
MRLSDLTPKQLRALALASGTSYDTLRHVASGRRGMSAEKAIVTEKAARRLRIDIRREDLAAACAGCEYAKQCGRKKEGET